jgi:tripartite-type tricarboxylate transporter receptor subunit TctC
MRFTRVRLILVNLLLVTLFVAQAHAQNYPTRPVHFIVPFPAGGVADVVARVIAQKLSETLGQQVVIENRSGASGTLGVDAVVKSPPDGYTLLLTTGDFITTPSLMPAMAFDPYKDLIPITMVVRAPLVLASNAAGPIGSLKDLIAAAKAAPGTVTFSSPGTGTVNHLAVEWVAIEAGIKLLHVPYRGGAPAATGLAAGDVSIGALTPSSAQPFIDASKIRVLGLMSKERPSFLSWPTLAEQGVDVDAALWVGLWAPAGTPAAIVNRLDEDMQKILKDDTVRARLNQLGTEASPISQDAFAKRIRLDADRYSKIIQQTGVKVDR